MPYEEEAYLMISELQHFSFCRRQWALIHLEQQWQENWRTVEGDILHERAHDDGFLEKRGGIYRIRGLRVHSAELGVAGTCDVVEFHASPDGIPLKNQSGTWLPIPVEYKRGVSKDTDVDRLQLCCQAMCLEEMLVCPVTVGYLYYGETRRREKVECSEELRGEVKRLLGEMHQLASRGYTPKVKPTKSCNACSLKDICLPKLCKALSAKQYIDSSLQEGDTV